MTSPFRLLGGTSFYRFDAGYNLTGSLDVVTVTNEYFDVSIIFYGGILKRWNGSAWVKAKLKTYGGVTFNVKPLKIFKAGVFQLVDTTGI